MTQYSRNSKLSKHYLNPYKRASDKAYALGDAIIRKRQENQEHSRQIDRLRRLLKNYIIKSYDNYSKSKS